MPWMLHTCTRVVYNIEIFFFFPWGKYLQKWIFQVYEIFHQKTFFFLVFLKNFSLEIMGFGLQKEHFRGLILWYSVGKCLFPLQAWKHSAIWKTLWLPWYGPADGSPVKDKDYCQVINIKKHSSIIYSVNILIFISISDGRRCFSRKNPSLRSDFLSDNKFKWKIIHT